MKKLPDFINDNNKMRISALALAISFLSSYGSVSSLSNKPVKVSEDLAYSAYADNENFPLTNRYLFDRKPDDIFVNYANEDYVDLSLTKNNFKLVQNITIDPLTCDLNDLYMMPNIKNMVINNSEFLTLEDKAIINNLPDLEFVRVNINNSYISKDDIIDVSWIKESVKVQVNFNTTIFPNDLGDLYLYYVVNNMPKEVTDRFEIEWFSEERLAVLKQLNDKLVKIIDSFNFDENTSEVDKILKIVKYVTDSIDYDPQVSESAKSIETLAKDFKVTEYNNKLVEMALNDEPYGICCNYAALTSMLAFYCGVTVNYVTGTAGVSPIAGHAWCSYDYDGEERIIDPTALDGGRTYNKSKDIYVQVDKSLTGHDEYLQDVFLGTVFLRPKSFAGQLYHPISMSTYNHTVKIGAMPREINYQNELSDRYYDTVMKPKAGLYAALSLTALLLFVAGIRLDLTDPKKRLERANPMKRTRKR